ncbi:MAG: hypothetical protein EPO11_00415 [Gammaproteobacteria bacterium]|nr:MAG: hypothetical protein EPO11_00415 [Gammaproteobacteria bacterium]
MQKILIFIIVLLFSISTFADVSVNGYYRKDGTYVQPHYRSNPNGNTSDNWSTKGNTNPYTGKEGTHNQDNNAWGN